MCSLWYWSLGGKKKGGMENNIQQHTNKYISIKCEKSSRKKDLMIELMTV